MERERTRELEAQPAPANCYEAEYLYEQELTRRSHAGKILVRSEDRAWRQTRQGLLKYYLSRSGYSDTALKDWAVFVHEIHVHSGKHTHQGGLVIYVLDGVGYSIVNGRREDWEAGDVLLLPVQLGGAEHQHFNLDPDKPARWLALIYKPLHDELASVIEQGENSPEYRPSV